MTQAARREAELQAAWAEYTLARLEVECLELQRGLMVRVWNAIQVRVGEECACESVCSHV